MESAITRRQMLVRTAGLATVTALATLSAACGGTSQTAAPTTAAASGAAAKPAATQAGPAATTATGATSAPTIAAAPTTAAAPAVAPTTAAGATPVAATKATGEVRFWYPFQQYADFLQQEQPKMQPDLKMKLEIGEFDAQTKIMAALSAGNPPDIAFLGRWQTCDLAVRNAIYALDSRVQQAKSWNWDDVWTRLQKDSTSWGKKWIVPYSTDTRAFTYNKQLMEDAGLDPEKPPKTWQDLVEQSVKATKKDASGKIDRIGFTPTFGNPPTYLMFYSMLWIMGSDIANDERTKIILQEKGGEALASVKDLMDKQGGYEAATAFTKSLTLAQGLDAFNTGKVTFAMQGNSVMTNYDKYSPNLKYGMIQGPTWTASTDEHLNYDGGGGLFYFKKGKNVDGAWALTEFLMTKDFYLNWYDKIGFLPVLKSVAAEWVQRDKRRDVFASTANTVHWIPIVTGTLEMLSFINKMWDEVLLGKTPADQAMKAAADSCQGILDKHNSYPPPQG